MLPLDSPLWQRFKGGYKVLYDASPALRRLFAGSDPAEVFEELWQELHHQGSVDQASYAAVPHLLEYARQSHKLNWNVFALIAVIQLEGFHNPEPVPEISEGYNNALRSLPAIVGSHPDQEWNDVLMQSITACIALARGQRILARLYLEMDLPMAREWLEEQGLDAE